MIRAVSASVLASAVVLLAACGGGGEGDPTGDGGNGGAGGARPAERYETDLQTVAATVEETSQTLEESGDDLTEGDVQPIVEQLESAVALIEQASPPANATDANARLLWALWASRDASQDLQLTLADGLQVTQERERLQDGLADAERALGELEELGLEVRPAGADG